MYGNTEHLHHECTWKNRRIIIDACELSPGDFEVMVMYKSSGRDIESYRTTDLRIAEKVYKGYLEKYHPEAAGIKPLTGKYLKLREDLKTALKAAMKAAEGIDDGGTCNLDACAVTLPRWRESLVKQAAKEAGTHCFIWNCYGKSFVFNPPSVGQANRNSAAAEAMTRTMTELGYSAIDYCQMD